MNSSARQAAEQIAALINSRAQSPRIEEIEAIIAGVTTRQDTSTRVMKPAPAVLEWHRMLAKGDRKWKGSELGDQEWKAMFDEQCVMARQAFARPVRSWEGVALLGAMCLYWNFAHHDENDQQHLRMLLAKTDHYGMDEQSLAHLLKAICTMGGFAPGEIPTEPKDDPSLAALQQRLEAVAQQYRDAKHDDEATRRADEADREMGAVSRRIFDARPISLHNLKQRAVLARYWHQFAYDAEKWVVPDDCGSWEDEVIAQLIHGVLQIDTPLDQPSTELALFRSASEGVVEFRRANPEPEVAGPGYDAWYEQHGERLDGVWKLAERILAGKAPPLDVLCAIAVHYVLDDHPELIASAADGDAHDSMATWIVARLLHAIQSIQPKAGE